MLCIRMPYRRICGLYDGGSGDVDGGRYGECKGNRVVTGLLYFSVHHRRGPWWYDALPTLLLQ